MDPSEGCLNTYHATSKQDDGKNEEELPSSSRFYPYIEIKEVPDIHTGSQIYKDEHKSQVTTQERNQTFGPIVSDDIFSSREDSNVTEERERQLAAVRKRARHLKDAVKKGNEINLDMKDKQLEQIVAAIADVCELKVTCSGKEFINFSDDRNKEMETASVSELIEKAERAAMIMKRDNSALTAKVDKAEREKMRSDELLPIRTNEVENDFSTEELAVALSNIKADISNENERHKELRRRLRKLKAPTGSVMEETHENSLQVYQGERGSDCGGSSHKSQDKMKPIRMSCLSPYHKLPPIPDPNSDSSTPKSPENQRELPDHMEPYKAFTNLKLDSTIPILVKQRSNTDDCTMRESGSTRWRPLEPFPTNESCDKQHERKPNRSPSPYSLDSPLPRHTRARRHGRHRYNESPLTCSMANNLSTRLPVKPKVGTTNSSRLMPYESIGMKRPHNVPIYIRKYRIHRRSRSVKLQAVSPTTGTHNLAELPDDMDSFSPCTYP